MTKIDINKRTSNRSKATIPRPLNSFMIFRMEHQASVSKEHPGATHQDISKRLSTKWRGLAPEEKQEYNKKALDAKEKHKLLYPDYKYRPRRKNGASKKTKKSTNSKLKAVGTDPSDRNYRPQVQLIDSLSEQLYPLPTNTLFDPLQAVDVTIDLSNALDDDALTTTTCFDSLLLCPTLNELSYQDPSASPSAFSMMSQFSGLSPSLSSDYESTAASHYSGYYDTMSVHPYYCGPVPNTCMPSPYDCLPVIDYSQMDPVAIPFDAYDTPIADLMPPQIMFPETEHQLPPAILDHTQPWLETDAQDTAHQLGFSSFSTYAPISDTTTLLTQPFCYRNFQAMLY